MNKFLTSLLILATVFLTASATAQTQPPKFAYESFLSDRVCSLNVSNATLGVTNLLGSGTSGTNTWGTVFTNCGTLLGRVMVTNNATITNTAATQEYFNLLSDVDLWAPDGIASGVPMFSWSTTTNVQYSIMVRLKGQSGANAAVTFVCVPLPDGTNESTIAADTFTFSVTATTTSELCQITNLPSSRFMSCKRLRMKSISNGDTDATSTVTILGLALLGWRNY